MGVAAEVVIRLTLGTAPTSGRHPVAGEPKALRPIGAAQLANAVDPALVEVGPGKPRAWTSVAPQQCGFRFRIVRRSRSSTARSRVVFPTCALMQTAADGADRRAASARSPHADPQGRRSESASSRALPMSVAGQTTEAIRACPRRSPVRAAGRMSRGGPLGPRRSPLGALPA
jgi:hypothetical protein